MKKPTKLNILGKTYTIEYVDNPSEVDIYKREALWGQIDYWTRTIRILDNNRSDEDILHSILHEVLHAINDGLRLDAFDDKHDDLDIVALALTDFLVRNKLIEQDHG